MRDFFPNLPRDFGNSSSGSLSNVNACDDDDNENDDDDDDYDDDDDGNNDVVDLFEIKK